MNRAPAGLAVAVLLSLSFSTLEAQQQAAPEAQPAVKVSPKRAMEQALVAVQAGRLQEGLAFYDSVLTNLSRDAEKYHPDAQFGAAMIRLAPVQSVNDPAWAQTALGQLTKVASTPHLREASAALVTLLERVAELNRSLDEQKKATEAAAAATAAAVVQHRKNVEDLTGKVDSIAAEVQSAKGDTDRLRQEINGLRAENRSVRDQLARTQAELEKKDAALRKIAGSIVNNPSR